MSTNDKATLVVWISTWLRTELKLADAELSGDTTFARFGVDSVHATMMIGDLEEHLSRRLSPTLAWDHPTINALATHLAVGVPAPPTGPVPDPGDVLSRLDTMSEAELDLLLERE